MNAAQCGDPAKEPGASMYGEHCSQFPDGQVQKAPTKTFLDMMTPEAIHEARSIGIMQPTALRLTDEQKHHVAEYISGSPVERLRFRSPLCSGDAAVLDRAPPRGGSAASMES